MFGPSYYALLEIVILIFLLNYCLDAAVVAKTENDQEERKRTEYFERHFLFPTFPTDIPLYPIRKNPYNDSENVSRGRFELLGGFPYHKDHPRRVSLQEFKETLQCSKSEPSLDDFYGTLSLLRLYPPSRETLELFCAWAETRCYNPNGDWSRCKREVISFRKGGYPKTFGMLSRDLFESFRLIRIMDGKLFYDWPWGIERVPPLKQFGKIYNPLIYLLNIVNDVKDSVFGFGGEHIAMPWKLPFPLIAEAGHYAEYTHATNIILWPWEQEFQKEVDLYQQIANSNTRDFSEQNVRNVLKTVPWEKKKVKAALYATYDPVRVVLMEQVARHPDLFDLQVEFSSLVCWSPACPLYEWDIKKI